MKFSFMLPLALGLSALFTACTNSTPENYFDKAVLNINMIRDFASETYTNRLISQNVKYDGVHTANGPEPATKDVNATVLWVEKNLKDIKDLKQTNETRDMLHTSIALFEFVLPVYKNEYTALARLSDQGGTKEDIQALGQVIDDKYGITFDSLYHVLTTQGKAYAVKHNIQVSWGK